MTQLVKTYSTAVLSKTPTDGSGRFEAIAYDSAAGDLDGIIITTTGLDNAIRKFNERGRPLVLRWGHKTEHPDQGLGVITRMWREGTRLMVAGQLDLKNPLSSRAYEAMLTGRLNELSIGWFENSDASVLKDGVIFMNDIELLEVSLVPQGANRGTRVTSVKATPIRDALRAELRALIAGTHGKTTAELAPNAKAVAEAAIAEVRRERAAKLAADARKESAVSALERFQADHVVPSKEFPWDDVHERPAAPVEHLGETISAPPIIKRSPRTETRDEPGRVPVVSVRGL